MYKKRKLRSYDLPKEGYVRLYQIIGDPKADPPVTGVLSICRSTWYSGIKSGIFPKPIKLGQRIAVWRVEDIRALLKLQEQTFGDEIDMRQGL